MHKPGFILPVPAWGGGGVTTNQGLGAQAGYTYLLGGLPVPYAGLRVGGKKGGVSLSGPLPMLGIDTGKRTGHWQSYGPRSLWKVLGDKLAEVRARKQVKQALANKLPGTAELAERKILKAITKRRAIARSLGMGS